MAGNLATWVGLFKNIRIPCSHLPPNKGPRKVNIDTTKGGIDPDAWAGRPLTC